MRPPPLHLFRQTLSHNSILRHATLRPPPYRYLEPPSTISRIRTFFGAFKRTPTSAPKPTIQFPSQSETSKHHAYPSRLLFYYVGKRSMFLGFLRLYGFTQLVFVALIAAPELGVNTEWGWYGPVGLTAAAAVPVLFVSYIAPPYVTHAFLKLPPYARYSKQNLLAFLKKMPRDTAVQFATIRWTGRPFLKEILLGDLRKTRERLGCVNLVARLKGDKDILYRFYMDPQKSPRKVDVPDVVPEVWREVERRTGEAKERDQLDREMEVGEEEVVAEEPLNQAEPAEAPVPESAQNTLDKKTEPSRVRRRSP